MRALLAISVLLVVAIAVVVVAASGNDPEPATQPSISTTAVAPTPTTNPPMLGNALSLTDLDGWLQSDVTSLEELRGQVVVVQFWTFGCSSCKAVLPQMQEIYSTYQPEGLEIVGVHSPEFSYEKDPDSITAAARDLGVTWPIALDTDRHNFRAWQGSPAYWPRTYVLDRNGLIRYDNIGGILYEDLAQTIVALLAE